MNEHTIRVLLIINYGSENHLKLQTDGPNFIVQHVKNMDTNRIQFDVLRLCRKKETHRVDGWLEEQLKPFGSQVFHINKPHFLETSFLRKILPSFIKKLIGWNKEEQYFNLFKNYRCIVSHEPKNIRYIFNIAIKAGVSCRVIHSHVGSLNEKESISRMLKRNLFGPIPATHFWACARTAGVRCFGKQLTYSSCCEWIKNAIDCERFAFNESQRNNIRSLWKIKDDEIVIGHIGHMNAEIKNHDFLINLFHAFHQNNPNSKLLLIGNGSRNAEYQKLISSLGLTNSVIFAGQQSNTQAYYSAMDCFILPSIYEGLPTALVEAQASGLPCLVSASITTQSQIRKQCSFVSLSAPFDVWVESILNLLKEENDRKTASSEVAKKGWDIKNNAHKMQRFYERQYFTPSSNIKFNDE